MLKPHKTSTKKKKEFVISCEQIKISGFEFFCNKINVFFYKLKTFNHIQCVAFVRHSLYIVNVNCFRKYEKICKLDFRNFPMFVLLD